MNCIIVGYDRSRAIGSKNELPWEGRMRSDMRRVRELTTGNAIIMGRKTFESIGRPLPNRQNIVLSRSPAQVEGVTFVSSLDDAYAAVDQGKNAFIFGGEQVYKLALEDGRVDRIYVTEINMEVDNPHAFFPKLDENEWKVVSKESYDKDDKNDFPFTFLTLDRIR